MRHFLAVAALLLFSSIHQECLRAAVIYDSLSFPGGGVGNGSLVLAQAVQLAGDARQVTQIDLSLEASGPGSFLVRFYELNGVGGTPGTVLWESSPQTYPYVPPLFNRKVVQVSVPNIIVPDRFAWAVKGENVARNFTVASSNAATVGTDLRAWIQNQSATDWEILLVNGGVFGARITAVPEPQSLAFLLSAAIVLGFRRAVRR